jgi:phosphopantetheine adenylyltransferase
VSNAPVITGHVHIIASADPMIHSIVTGVMIQDGGLEGWAKRRGEGFDEGLAYLQSVGKMVNHYWRGTV